MLQHEKTQYGSELSVGFDITRHCRKPCPGHFPALAYSILPYFHRLEFECALFLSRFTISVGTKETFYERHVQLNTTPDANNVTAAYFWRMLHIIIMDVVVRGRWADDGLEGFFESQRFVCDAAAFLPRQLLKLMTVDSGYLVQRYEIRWCHGEYLVSRAERPD
jgi:hypothetical protein